MKKIMFIQQTGLFGGSGISLLNTIEMVKDDYEVVVYCPAYPQDLTNVLNEHNIKVVNYNFQIGSLNFYSGGPKLFSRSFILAFTKILQNRKFWKEHLSKEKPDIVAVNSMILAWMEPLISKVGAKSICFVRETLPSGVNLVRRIILKRYLNNFTGVAFLSEFDKNKFKLNKTQNVIIRDSLSKDVSKSITYESFQIWGFEREKLNILFVGGYDPIKGLHIALRALKKINGLSCQLVVAGYSSYKDNEKKINPLSWWRKRYQRKINKLLNEKEIKHKVKIIGLQKDMSEVYKSSDLLLFPSTVPHQSRPAFEIGLYSKPVIISDFPETREYVINNKNGLVFSPKNHTDLAAKIALLYEDKTKIKRLGSENLNMTKKLRLFNIVKRDLVVFLSRISE